MPAPGGELVVGSVTHLAMGLLDGFRFSCAFEFFFHPG